MKSRKSISFESPSGNCTLPPELVEAFALAVVRHNGRALLIDSSNRGLGWVPIAEAVSHCFAVEPAPDVLPGDFDHFDGEDRATALASDLAACGLHAVVVASGRPGHTHLFARIADAALLDRFKMRARALGGHIPNAIRPPGAAHRLGLPVRLIDPTDPQEALRVLRALPPATR